LGALLGALIIQIIDNGIVILNVDQNYSQIIIGSVIILAVLFDRINGALRDKRRTRAARLTDELPVENSLSPDPEI
jgi:ribose transport system permease protein